MTDISPVPASVQKTVKRTGKTSSESGTEFAGLLDRTVNRNASEKTQDKSREEKTERKEDGSGKKRTEKKQTEESDSNAVETAYEEIGQSAQTELMMCLEKMMSETSAAEQWQNRISTENMSDSSSFLDTTAVTGVETEMQSENVGAEMSLSEGTAAEAVKPQSVKTAEQKSPERDADGVETENVSEQVLVSENTEKQQSSKDSEGFSEEPEKTAEQKKTVGVREEKTNAADEDDKSVLSQQEISSRQISFQNRAEEARGSEVVRTTDTQMPQDVGESIASRMPDKNGELILELEPNNLGKIIVKVTYESDRATIALIASNPKTLEILSKDAENIAGIIQDKTGQETVVQTPQNEDASQHEGEAQEHASHQEEREQRKDRKKEESESFLQQFRLGLV